MVQCQCFHFASKFSSVAPNTSEHLEAEKVQREKGNDGDGKDSKQRENNEEDKQKSIQTSVCLVSKKNFHIQ